MDSPWLRDEHKNIKIWNFEKLKKNFEKFPSLNASSPLECLFKPEGRAWAAGGGPEASNLKLQLPGYAQTKFNMINIYYRRKQLNSEILKPVLLYNLAHMQQVSH